jgi:hypothetical protein
MPGISPFSITPPGQRSEDFLAIMAETQNIRFPHWGDPLFFMNRRIVRNGAFVK